MTHYLQPAFTVGGWRAPNHCAHGWTDPKGRCVLCGASQETVAASRRVSLGRMDTTPPYGVHHLTPEQDALMRAIEDHAKREAERHG